MTPLRLGTRGSRLAHAQAALAGDALRSAGLGPVAIVPISTAGDRDRRSAYSELGGRGVFSKELEDALLEGRIDVAVHSAKDLTTDETPGLSLAAVLPRADARDAWCGPHASLTAVPHGARVGTASMRRGAQLGALRPDLRVESLRGNVDTRLRKRTERGLDGVVLAACGLDRLGLGHEIGFRVDVEEMLPETGQGFLALQARSEDADALAVVGEAEAARILETERACAALLGGGCRAPVATHAVTLPGGMVWLRAWLALPDGSVVVQAEARGDDAGALAGEVAAAALGRGGEAIVAAVRA
ncbi:MAG: hydroxymethylbilane synthase [Gaiellales bacterium]|nr:hydroxymethylbilane synthase [Gaiellales bacterium]